jgi:iron complex transport system substrate-binding protein
MPAAREKPPRIATLLAGATEIVYGIGLGECVVAISHECDFPPEATGKPRVTRSNVNDQLASGEIDAQVKELTHAGAPLYAIDEARLAKLAPELIVTQAQCDVCAVRYEDVVAAVKRHPSLAGAKVIAINPASIDDVLEDIVRIGEAAGDRDAAIDYRARLQGRLASITDRTAPLAEHERPRVAMVEWIEPLMLAGNWMPEMVRMAGGQTVMAEAGRASTYADWRELLAYDPEVLIVAPCGFDLSRTLREASMLAEQDGWSGVAAIRAGRVFAVDGNAYFNRSGPRLVDSVEILAHLIHPGRFPMPDCVAHPHRVWRQLP